MRVVLTSYRLPDGKRRRPRQTLGREWVTLEVLTARGIVVMCAKRWSGWVTWSIARVSGDVLLWPDDWSYEELKVMKRKTTTGPDAAAAAEASRSTRVFSTMPHVLEHCSVRSYDDNAARAPGRILLDTVGSMWRAIAKDVDSGMQLVVYMPSIDDCLLQLELLLGSDEAPWEPDPYAKQKGPSKSKK